MVDGYACGTCNKGFPSKRAIVEHMVKEHDSPYIEGDKEMVEWSKTIATQDKNERALRSISTARLD